MKTRQTVAHLYLKSEDIRRSRDERKPFNKTNGARGTRLVNHLCSSICVGIHRKKEGGSPLPTGCLYDRPVCQSRLGGGDAKLETPTRGGYVRK